MKLSKFVEMLIVEDPLVENSEEVDMHWCPLETRLYRGTYYQIDENREMFRRLIQKPDELGELKNIWSAWDPLT